MKTQPILSLIAVGALLPLAAWGDDARTQNTIQREAYDPRPSETRSGPPTSRMTESTEFRSHQETHERAEPIHSSATTPALTESGAVGAGIERLSQEQMERRLTASELIGTKVVDREGQEVGKVKDIGLTAVAPQLAAETDTRTIARNSPDSTPGAPSSGLSQPWTQSGGATKEARVFVRPSRALGAGDALVAIPATQLHREGDALRIDLSREELRSLVGEQEASRVSMNP